MTHDTTKRGKKGRESVDGKHPDGSGARKSQIPSAKGVEGGKYHFEKPAQQPAVYIVVNPFFHIYEDIPIVRLIYRVNGTNIFCRRTGGKEART